MDFIILVVLILLLFILFLSSIKYRGICDDITILDRKSTDALRGIATSAIVIHHFCQYATDRNILFLIFSFIGDLCVAVFFLLSGYSNRMSYVKMENESVKRKVVWGGNKIIRVIITYLVIYIITVPLQIYYYPDVNLDVQCLKNIFTLSYYKIGIWYIRIQILLYVLFLICFIAIANKYATIFLCGFSIVICFVLKELGLASFWYNTFLCLYIPLLSLLLLLFVCSFGLKSHGIFNIIYPLVFCCFVTAFLFEFGLNSKLFSWIGSLSLELYLVHIVFVKYFIIDNFGDVSLGFKYLSIILTSGLLSYLIHQTLTNRILTKIKKLLTHSAKQK